MKRAFVKTKKNHATFIYIPEGESSVVSNRIPQWLPKAIIITVAVLVVFSIICTFFLTYLRSQYHNGRNDIKRLTQINNSQKNKIEELQKNAEEIRKQLEENAKILQDLKKAAGIKDTIGSADNQLNDGKGISGLEGFIPNSAENLPQTGLLYSDMSNQVSSIESSFKSLSTEALSQKQEMERSLGTIKNKASEEAYTNAKPSVMPVIGAITCSFGNRKNPITSRGTEFHKGVDFGVPYGSTVSATADGRVIFAGWQGGYGKVVLISHGYGYVTVYGHNSKLLVKQGDTVKRGQSIAKAGSTGRSTGSHLHYEVRLNGKSMDPTRYF